MTPARFVATFTEFAQSDQSVVAAKLAQASARMGGPDTRVWGGFAADTDPINFADNAQGNLAAWYLRMDPMGASTRAEPNGDGSKDPYYLAWQEAMYAVAGGVTVGGGRRGLFPAGWY